MPPDATTEQLLHAISRTCDVIDQRFTQYVESILACMRHPQAPAQPAAGDSCIWRMDTRL